MKTITPFIFAFLFYNVNFAQDIYTPFQENDNTTIEYEDLISAYANLAALHPEISRLDSIGLTDSGKPLHLFRISTDPFTTYREDRESGKLVYFILNGIHPGEPCGIDASLLWAAHILNSPFKSYLEDVVIYLVPVYNVGGMLNRGIPNRPNQNGPEEYGFRGNSRNYDLNRDFIKLDSRNARSIVPVLSRLQPHIFIDTHTSNGADYPYAMTLLPTQADKANPIIAEYLKSTMLPYLYRAMEIVDFPMVPYVYSRGTPDNGIMGFLDLPRYSNGFANLFNALAFTSEAHMLKPYNDRVLSTRAFLEVVLKFGLTHKDEILENKATAEAYHLTQNQWDFQWKLNWEKEEKLPFKGYTAKYKPSEVTDQDRLYYDKNEPYEKDIPYFPHYDAGVSVTKPAAYVIPQAYYNIAELLLMNGIKIDTIRDSREFDCTFYKIKDFKTVETPFEGHYLHSDTEVEAFTESHTFQAGDFIVSTYQPNVAFLMHVLEPASEDSYFNWNFFDGILQRKEYFSPYVFEDMATEYLNQHPELREELEKAKEKSKDLRESAWMQLQWVHERGPWNEKTFRLYPIARIEK